MNPIYWGWLAVALDLSLFIGPLSLDNSTAAFLQVTLLHLGASALFATCAYLLLPKRYRQARLWAWILMWDFAFVAPVVGALGVLLIIQATLKRDADKLGYAIPRTVALPEYNVRSKEVSRTGQSAIRSRLNPRASAAARMQSLLTLQAVPGNVANPILESLLGDGSDDVRLIAFGMLDAAEKRLSGPILREQRNLERELTLRQRYDCLRHLAELNWELVYGQLVQGELRKHVLREARRYLEQALALDFPRDGGIYLLMSKIFLGQGDTEAARVALEDALRLGQAQVSVLPYSADLAFRQRQFARVHDYMLQLEKLHVASRTLAIVALWTGRDNVQHFRDRRILHHL